jgi:hypothetical protein
MTVIFVLAAARTRNLTKGVNFQFEGLKKSKAVPLHSMKAPERREV